MATYRVKMMTKRCYHEYITGGDGYWMHEIDIEANSTEEAIEITRKNNPDWVILEDSVLTVEEIKREAALFWAAIEANEKIEKEKKARAKVRKAEREKAKAKALGLTVKEYKAKIEHDKEVRDTEAQIIALKTELAKKEKYLEKLKEEG